MAYRVGPSWLPVVLLATGCLPGPSNTTLVPTSPFPTGNMPKLPATLTASPEMEQESIRVALAGQKLLQANPTVPVKPRFTLIGVPGTEIFHRGADEVFVTEGLSEKCKTEGQLAAVLCQELGKMVSEREAAKRFLPAVADPDPPPDVPVGNDNHGTFGPDDGTRMMELGKYEQERHKHRDQAVPAPEVLARTYLEKAGFGAAELSEVAPLLRTARDSVALEKQLNGQLLPTAQR